MKKVFVTFLFLTLAILEQNPLAQSRSRPRKGDVSRPEYYKQIDFREDTQTVTKAILKNGLTVLINESHTIPLAAIVTYVKFGSADEPNQAQGTAELLKNIYLSGSKKRGVGGLYRDTLAIGGQIRGAVDYDNTILTTIVPGQRIAEAIEIQADALLNPSFDEMSLKRAPRLLTQEAIEKQHGPEEYAKKKLFQLVFDKPAPPPLGNSEASIPFIQDQAVKYFQEYYAPNNIILSVCGDVNTEDVVKEVVKRYSSISRAKVKKRSLQSISDQTSLQYQEIRGDISQAYLEIGYRLTGLLSKDHHGLAVLAAILGEGQGSIFNQRLKEKLSLVRAVTTELLTFKNGGTLSIHLQLDPKSIDKAELAVLTEIEALKKEDISEQDFNRALAVLERDYNNRLETVDERAQNFARFEDSGSFKGAEKHIDTLRKLTLEDIYHVLDKYLKIKNCSVVEYQPRTAEPRGYTPDSFRKTIEQILPAAAEQRLNEKPTTRELLQTYKPSNEHYKFIPSQLIFPLNRASIRGGPEIYIKEEHSLPSITVGIFFAGGKLQEDETNSGTTELMLRTLIRGTDKKSQKLFPTQFEIWGGKISTVVEDDYFGYVLTLLSKNTEEALKLLLEALRDPKFDDDENTQEKEVQIGLQKRDSDDFHAHAVALFKKAAFAKLPYGLPKHGLEAVVRNLKSEDLRTWFKAHVTRAKPIITIVGDTEGTALASFFARNLKYVDYEVFKAPVLKETKPSSAGMEKVVRETAQTATVVGFPFFENPSESIYPLELMQSLVRAQGEILVQISDGFLGGAVFSYVESTPENETQAVESIKTIFSKLKSGAISDDDFRRGINSTIGSYYIQTQDRQNLIHRTTKNSLLERTFSEPSDYPNKIRSISKEELAIASRRLIDTEHPVIGVIKGGQQAVAK